MKGERRAVTKIILMLRNFLYGRESSVEVRHLEDLSPRSPCPPNLPRGPHQKLSGTSPFPNLRIIFFLPTKSVINRAKYIRTEMTKMSGEST